MRDSLGGIRRVPTLEVHKVALHTVVAIDRVSARHSEKAHL